MKNVKNLLIRVLTMCIICSALMFGFASKPVEAATFSVTPTQVQNWIESKVGTTINNGGTQCVAAFNQYIGDLYGINWRTYFPVTYAKQIYDKSMPNGFSKIGIPSTYRVGDIVIFYPESGRTAGHVAIVYSVSGNKVILAEQNYGTNKKFRNDCQLAGRAAQIKGVIRPDITVHTHNYRTTQTVTKIPTETEAGIRKLTCSCGESKTESIPALTKSSVSYGTYRIISKCSGKYVTVPSGTNAAGDNVYINSSGNGNQIFKLKQQSDGSYIIYSGSLVVDLDKSNIAGNVLLYTNKDTDNQRWYFVPVGDGYYRIVSKATYCNFDVNNSATADGTNILTWYDNGCDNQRFKLEPVYIPITSVSLNKIELSLIAGNSATLNATVKPEDTTRSKTISWTSSNTAVAKVSSTGKVTAVKAGKATITATSTNGKKATCLVTVTAKKPITSITLSRTSLSLAAGKSKTLTVTYNPIDTTDAKTVTWSSSNTAVAKVSTTGKITAVKAGTATIKATTANGKYASCKVTVTGVKVVLNANGGTVSPTYLSCKYNQAYGTLPTPTRKDYTFTGWYTAASGGTKVTASTIVATKSNHTLYARWKSIYALSEGNYTVQNVGTGYMMNYAYCGLKGVYYLPFISSKADGSPEQTFYIQHAGNGEVWFKITHSNGGVMNVERAAGQTAVNGDPISARSLNSSSPLQKFIIEPVGNNQFIIRSASNKNLVVAPKTSEWHALFQLQTYNSANANQRWTFTQK